MVFDRNGVVIKDVISAQTSVLGSDYVVMWDSDGAPIHIHKDVLTYLYEGLNGKDKPPVPDVTSVFVTNTK